MIRTIQHFTERGTIIPIALLAGVMVGAMSLLAAFVLTESASNADMRIETRTQNVRVGDTFTADVVVEARVPANVFAGELLYDPSILQVVSINYNTSVANLWAEKPWYDNGAGTLNFGGGTTKSEGFTGTSLLLSTTFRTIKPGNGTLSLKDARILLHDGLGTDATLGAPIDTVLAIEEFASTTNMVLESPSAAHYQIYDTKPSPDLNGDGKIGIADVSIFMMHFHSNDHRYDFNSDGNVNLKDLNILLGAL